MDIILKYFIYGILLLMLRECRAIKINSMSVPSRYELKNDNHRLVLDCDYSVDDDEKGFVLKWLRDNVPIYQWIPSRLPFALGSYRNRIDLSYESDPEHRFKKHSALVILNPTTSDTGNFTCNVQSYTSNDKKTEEMIIIDPADSVSLTYVIDQENQGVSFECSVVNIFPLPEVKFLFSNGRDFPTKLEKSLGENNLNITITTEFSKDEIEDESDVTCLVQIPNTEYEAKETVTYDDPKQTPSDKKSMSGEYRSQSDTAGDENLSHRIASSVNLLIIVMIAVILGR